MTYISVVSIGLIADRLPSKQTPFLWGLVFLALTTLAFAVGRTLPVLVIARTLQGLSSAIVFGVGFAILYEVVGKERMGTVSGWTGLAVSLGTLVGPVAGGLLYEYAGYFQVFLPAFGLLIVDIMMRLMYLPSEKKKVQLAVETVSEVTWDASAPTQDQSKPDTPESEHAASTNVDESTPLLREPSSPCLPPSVRDIHSHSSGSSFCILLSSPRLLTTLLASLYLCSVPAGLDATLPVYLRDSFHLSSAETVPFFMVLCVPLLLSPVAGFMTDRLGPKVPAALSLAWLALGMLGMRLVTPEEPAWRPVLLTLLICAGLGSTLGFPPFTADVGHAVAAIEEARPGSLGPGGAYAQAYGLMNAASALGSMVGPLYAGFVKDRLGWGWTMTSLGLMAVGILVLVIAFTGQSWARGERDSSQCDMQDRV